MDFSFFDVQRVLLVQHQARCLGWKVVVSLGRFALYFNPIFDNDSVCVDDKGRFTEDGIIRRRTRINGQTLYFVDS